MPLAMPALLKFRQGGFRIPRRAETTMALLELTGRYRPALTFNPLDQLALSTFIVGFGQYRIDSPGFSLEPLGQPDASLHTGLIYRILAFDSWIILGPSNTVNDKREPGRVLFQLGPRR